MRVLSTPGLTLTTAVLIIAGVFATAAGADPGPAGLWRLSTGKVTVRVRYCGGQKLCASIAALARPYGEDGKPKRDHDNPNPALRNRQVVGLQVASGMAPAGPNRWVGKIYNADDGGTYRSEIRLSGDVMILQGCWGPFCKKNRFTRVR